VPADQQGVRRKVNVSDVTPTFKPFTRVSFSAFTPYNERAMAATREKQFHTQCQEEVYRQVKAYLDELVDEHFDDAEHCDFYLKYGSTVLEISIHPWEEDDAVIEILAFCVKGVEVTRELMAELLELNTEVVLGAFSMVGNEIFFSHSFLGRRLRPEQLITSLDMVASTSDEYDEQIVAKYGGETALERLRGQRQPLTSGSPHN
jgi:hypothetical protein